MAVLNEARRDLGNLRRGNRQHEFAVARAVVLARCAQIDRGRDEGLPQLVACERRIGRLEQGGRASHVGSGRRGPRKPIRPVRSRCHARWCDEVGLDAAIGSGAARAIACQRAQVPLVVVNRPHAQRAARVRRNPQAARRDRIFNVVVPRPHAQPFGRGLANADHGNAISARYPGKVFEKLHRLAAVPLHIRAFADLSDVAERVLIVEI